MSLRPETSMIESEPATFVSYCREDSEFALRLAADLKVAGANVWLDQLDIVPGQRWDRAVEDALANCQRILVLLSPASVNSINVMDEVSFALEEKKIVVPVVYRDCAIPLRLRRVQHIDLRQDYSRGFKEVLKTLAPEQAAASAARASTEGQTNINNIDDRRSVLNRTAQQLDANGVQPVGADQGSGKTSELEPHEAGQTTRADATDIRTNLRRLKQDEIRQGVERQTSVATDGPEPEPAHGQSSSQKYRRRLAAVVGLYWVRVSFIASVLLVALTLSVAKFRSTGLKVFPGPSRNLPGIPSLEEGEHVIVLPFEILGDRDTLGYVAEALDEELSRKLCVLTQLHVVSASAAKTQAQQQSIDLNGPAEKIARNFGINLLLHGTIQEGGGWTRINVSFDDVADGRNLLTRGFAYPTADINLLGLEDQVYKVILSTLHLKPGTREQKRAANPTNNDEAYQYYVQAQYAVSRRTNVAAVGTAIGFYERALREDRSFALAYVGLSNASRAEYVLTGDPSWVQKARDSAGMAQQLNNDLPEVHLALGDIYRELGRTRDAIAEIQQAKELSPISDLPWLRLGKIYEDAGQRIDAIDAYTKAIEINPYSLADRNQLGAAYFIFSEYEKALDQFSKVIELDPTNYQGYMNSGAVHIAQGKYEQSIQDLEKALRFSLDGAAGDAQMHSDLGTAYFYMKRYTESVKENEIAVKIAPNQYDLKGNLADAYRWAGNKSKASEAYKAAIELATEQVKINPNDADALESLALFYAKSGIVNRGADCIRQARLIDASRSDLIYSEAVVEAIADQRSQALKSLRLALEKGYPIKLVEADPEFGRFRHDDEFQVLLKQYLR